LRLGSPQAIKEKKRALAKRKGRWLHKGAKAMCKVTLKDWDAWRRGWKNWLKAKSPVGTDFFGECGRQFVLAVLQAPNFELRSRHV